MQTLLSSFHKLFLFFDAIRLNVLSNLTPEVICYIKYGIFISFLLAVLAQLNHYIFVLGKFIKYKKEHTDAITNPVSIIICAKNEDENLTNYLPLVLTQDYPEYEVIVVNHCSYDNTSDVLEEMAKKYKHLKIVTIKQDDIHNHGKKFAVMCGIKGAKHELLLHTDADCRPSNNQWLKSMVTSYTNTSTDIVFGYGAYEKRKGFLNKMIRFDTFNIALQYMAFAIAGKPYMGVGRNLSYKKALFFKHKGFASHYHIESGDDDLFINEVATPTNTAIELNPDSFTYSIPKKTLKEWFNQKRRHITTYKYYKPDSIKRLTAIAFFQYAFWILFILALLINFQPIVVLSAFLLRVIVQLYILKKAMDRLHERDLLLFSLMLEFVLLFIYPAISFSNSFVKENKWKS